MKRIVPFALIQGLAWAGGMAFLALALLDWHLGKPLNAIFALFVAGTVILNPRRRFPCVRAALQQFWLLIWGIAQLWYTYELMLGF